MRSRCGRRMLLRIAIAVCRPSVIFLRKRRKRVFQSIYEISESKMQSSCCAVRGCLSVRSQTRWASATPIIFVRYSKRTRGLRRRITGVTAMKKRIRNLHFESLKSPYVCCICMFLFHFCTRLYKNLTCCLFIIIGNPMYFH